MHISRLRNQVRTAAANVVPNFPTASVDLDLRDSRLPLDQLPSMRPELTSASVDTIIGNILATIPRERYSAIGILSTDKRDHLFLAQRIVNEVLHALLFSTEADLIYVHPNYRPYVRGALVASTYPLFNATQLLTNPALGMAGRQQFPSMGAQGIYNAALTLLEREDRLLDYVRVGGRDDRLVAPIWMSVVGQDALWPVDVHPDDAQTAVFPPADRVGQVSRWMKALFPLILLGTIVQGLFYLFEVLRGGALVRRLFPKPPTGRVAEHGARLRHKASYAPVARLLQAPHSKKFPHREYRLYLCASLVATWLVSAWSLGLAAVLNSGGATLGLPGHIVIVGLVTVPVVWLAFEGLRTVEDRPWNEANTWITAGVALLALLIAFSAAWHFGQFLYTQLGMNADTAWLLFTRAIHLSNWVSPATPVFLLSLVVYLWALWNLRQLRMGGWRYRSRSGLFEVLTGGDIELADEIVEFLRAPWQRQHLGCLVLPAAVTAIFWLQVPFGYTPDGFNFTRFLWFGSLLVLFLMAHTLGQVVHLWLLLRRVS